MSALSKVPGKACACTSMEKGFSAASMMKDSPDAEGWMSDRFCDFPQEVGFKLDERSQIQQIQLLSHHANIATRVELFVGDGNRRNYKDIEFHRLGYLSLDNNERSGYQARELKTVFLDSVATHVKLVVHKCHITPPNLYNQVGIVSMKMFGRPANSADLMPAGVQRPPPPMDAPVPQPALSAPAAPITGYFNPTAAPTAGALDLASIDPLTKAKLERLLAQKNDAIAKEDYDAAKRLKQEMDAISNAAVDIGRMEQEKARAVAEEDYDKAKELKMQIDALRSGRQYRPSGRIAVGTPPAQHEPSVNTRRAVQAYFGDDPDSPEHHRSTRAAGSVHGGSGGGGSPLPGSPGYTGGQAFGSPAHSPIGSGGGGAMGGGGSELSPGGGKMTLADRDDIPLQSLKTELNINDAISKEDAAKANATRADPEPIPATLMKEAQPLIDVFGDNLIGCLYSSDFSLRQYAVGELMAQVPEKTLSIDKSLLFRLVCHTACLRAVGDKMTIIYVEGQKLLTTSMQQLAAEARRADVEAACDALVPILFTKAGDPNTNVSKVSADNLVHLAKVCGDEGVSHVAAKVSRDDARKDKAWRVMLMKTKTLLSLVKDHGLIAHMSGMSLEAVMGAALRAMNHADGKVRAAAVELIVEVHKLVGDGKVEPFLKDMSQVQLEAIQKGIGGAGAGSGGGAGVVDDNASSGAGAGGRGGRGGRGAGRGSRGRGNAAAAGRGRGGGTAAGRGGRGGRGGKMAPGGAASSPSGKDSGGSGGGGHNTQAANRGPASPSASEVSKSIETLAPNAPMPDPLPPALMSKPFTELQGLADGGDKKAAILVASACYQGPQSSDSKINYNTAYSYLQKASDGPDAHVLGLAALAGMVMMGVGCRADEEEARALAQRAVDGGLVKLAQSGDSEARFRLGVLAFHRCGVDLDDKVMLGYFRDAGKTHLQGRYFEAVCFSHGYGAPQDEGGALDIWRELASDESSGGGGLAMAQHELGVRYRHGDGVEVDDEAAVRYFKDAAAQGHPEAHYDLGDYYHDGSGGLDKDEKLAIEYWQLAARQGITAAQERLTEFGQTY